MTTRCPGWTSKPQGATQGRRGHEHLAEFLGAEGVLFVGRAQEKTAVFRTEKRRDANGDSYPWIVKTTGWSTTSTSTATTTISARSS